jgi:hypothetical protein
MKLMAYPNLEPNVRMNTIVLLLPHMFIVQIR